MKTTLKILVLLFLSLKVCYSQNDFSIDYKMAEKCIDWLEFINAGADTAEARTYFMKNVAPTEGCKTIIAHWERFRDWDNNIFYEFIAEALGLIKSNRDEYDEEGNLSHFGRRKKLWNNALNNTESLEHDIKLIREMNLTKQASDLARKFLPEDADLKNKFYIVLFGASTAFSVGERNGFDLLQLPRNKDNSINAESVLLTFAHELHHTGFSSTAGKNMETLKNENKIMLAGILAAEGMATYFINKPFEKIESYRNLKQEIYHRVASDWETHLQNIGTYYPKAAVDLEKSINGEIDQNDIFDYWLEGAAGKAYALGVDMFSVIEKYLGTETAVNIAKDYRTMLSVYNRAAQIGISQGEDLYLFDENLVKAVLQVN